MRCAGRVTFKAEAGNQQKYRVMPPRRRAEKQTGLTAYGLL
jgi:hypothetical protein